MPLKIVTDSTCDLPPDIINAWDISVIPLYINIGKQGFLDGIELSRTEFYQNLPAYPTHPTTAAPGPDAFRQVYTRLAAEGATEILSIHISGSLSATLNAVTQAAADFNAVPVTVLDSGQLSLGTGFLVETAARAAAEGRSLAEVLPVLRHQMARSHVMAAIDSLEYLRRSGRLNGVIAGLGSLLQLKPILTMHQGQAGSERVRTRTKSLERTIAMLETVAPLERLALVHTNAPAEAEALMRRVKHVWPQTEILSVDITPVLGAHLGPGAVGFACVSAER